MRYALPKEETLSNSAFFAIWFFAPFVAGLVLTVILRACFRRGAVSATLVGVVLALGIVVAAYFSSPLSSAPYNGCSDCESYLGRWWEPQFVGVIAGGGFVFWLVGVGVGAAVAAALRRAMTRDERST